MFISRHMVQSLIDAAEEDLRVHRILSQASKEATAYASDLANWETEGGAACAERGPETPAPRPAVTMQPSGSDHQEIVETGGNC